MEPTAGGFARRASVTTEEENEVRASTSSSKRRPDEAYSQPLPTSKVAPEAILIFKEPTMSVYLPVPPE